MLPLRSVTIEFHFCAKKTDLAPSTICSGHPTVSKSPPSLSPFLPHQELCADWPSGELVVLEDYVCGVEGAVHQHAQAPVARERAELNQLPEQVVLSRVEWVANRRLYSTYYILYIPTNSPADIH